MNSAQSFRNVLTALALTGTFATAASAQTGTVGIYTDESGTTCSFSGNDPGIVTAYVVVRPGPEGIRAVRFSAPVPACFGGVSLEDKTANDLPFIGDSQTGISVASGNCETRPLHVLTITYMRTSSTTPCCPYSVLPEAGFDTVVALNCNGVEVPFGGATGYFNADGTCACSASVAPFPASGPSPLDGQLDVSHLYETLGWSASDYDGDLVDFDIYLGTGASPPMVASHVTATNYQAVLQPSTHYYWRIVSRDSRDNETSSATWEFTTRAHNSPPVAPRPITPDVGAVTGRSVQLEWESGDLDHDYPLRYDVYFDTTNPPARIVAGQTQAYKNLGTLMYSTTYYWRIVVSDAVGNESVGDVWHFTTRAGTNEPGLPHSPSPVTGQAGVPVTTALSWKGSASSYSVYLGKFGTVPRSITSSQVATHVQPADDLTPETEYYWYVVAHSGGENVYGPVWHFYTAPLPPNLPTNPNLSYNANQSTTATLTWSVKNTNGRSVAFDVYFGTKPSPPLSAHTSESSLTTAALLPGQHYYWRVDAWDGETYTTGSEWTFTTPPIGLTLGTGLTLGQNHPNPFNPQTTIPYYIKVGGHVRVAIYDPAGRLVRTLVNQNLAYGLHEVVWDGADNTGATASSGVYFCVLDSNEERRIRKLVMLK